MTAGLPDGAGDNLLSLPPMTSSGSKRSSTGTKLNAGMSPNALIELCENVLKTFNPLRGTLDSHAEAELGPACGHGGNSSSSSTLDKEEGKSVGGSLSGKQDARKMEDMSANDRVFVKQVLYGCVRYKKALKALLTSFYYNNGATTSRGDYTKYMVLSYLALYRLEELGMPGFSQIVYSQAAEKMHVFLSYLFDIPTIEKWVKDEWIKYYDLTYVEKTLVGSLEKFSPQVMAICEDLSSHAFGAAQKREEEEKQAGMPEVFVKPPTVVQPFNITPARPVRVPQPHKIKQEIVANPVPKNLNARSLSAIAQERKAAKERKLEETLSKYSGAKEFDFHETRDTLSNAIEEQQRQLAAILNKKFVATEAPDFSSKPAEVRMNASAVLREDNVYKKKQAQEAKLLQAYEEDLRDSTEYYEWLSEQRRQQEEDRLARVEQRRLESEESQIQARKANLRKVEENRRVAAAMRENGKVHAEALEKQHIEFVAGKRRMVARVQSTKDIPAKEQAKILARNKRVNKEMRAKQAALEAIKRQEDEQEQLRRNDLIRRIRAIERVPNKKPVEPYDPTQSGGHGLLEEMSLLELKERLAINEMNEKKAHAAFSRKIVEKKMLKDKAMQARIEVIRRARDAAAAANRKSRQRKKELDEEKLRTEQEVKDAAKIEMSKRLAKIRAAREEEIRALQEEEEKLVKRNLFLGAAKDMVEEKVHREVVKGQERTSRLLQREAQTETIRREQIMRREKAIRVENQKRALLAEKAAEAHAAALFDKSRRKTKQKAFVELGRKRAAYHSERVRYSAAVEKLKTINPYATAHASGLEKLN